MEDRKVQLEGGGKTGKTKREDREDWRVEGRQGRLEDRQGRLEGVGRTGKTGGWRTDRKD